MNFNSDTSSDYGFKELSSLTGVKPYVLRFWESEFEQICPITQEDGSKVYSQTDRDSIEQIKELLFGQKLSIQEAKSMLDQALKQKIIQAEEAQAEEVIAEKIDAPEEVLIEAEVPVVAQERTFAFESSLELMKQSLGSDLAEKQEESAPMKATLNIDYTEKDMLSLLHAKKKLKVAMSKIDEVFVRYQW